ncbi:MAG: cation:proton antiporter [Deltaproteobacteria bacterium]|nr:cation:proton antiporter [Deltaproteobacteria bacterium]
MPGGSSHPGVPSDLLMLLVLLAGSFAMPLLAGRMRMPSAVLLIGFGLAVGPHGLGGLADTDLVGLLAEFGFMVLMFLAGLEIDFNEIRTRGIRSLAMVLSICVLVFGLSFLAAFALGLSPIFGLALGATSVGLPLAVLKESGRLRTSLGQQVILLGSVGEALTVIGMTLYYFGSRHGLSVDLLVALAKLVGVLAIAGLSLRFGMALAWWQPSRLAKLVEEHDGSEIGVRAALLVMMVFSMLAVWAGVEPIVGAFLAGALIAFVLRGKEILEEKLAVVGHGLLVPIFFVVVGVRFDPSSISWPNLALAGELLLATFLARLLPSLALLRQGIRTREMLGVASLLSAPLTLVVAIASLGAALGDLSSQETNTLILLAVLAGLVFPVAFRFLLTGD